ncbi:MAG: AarF/ABC1/UbiB kinase family protein [Synechococcaceae cyanobacterium SM2_3_1]|nr:AarF/ABC1/UbiB kinase family protein [Synechococcaceae cyanobacterium SM2_3_1]
MSVASPLQQISPQLNGSYLAAHSHPPTPRAAPPPDPSPSFPEEWTQPTPSPSLRYDAEVITRDYQGKIFLIIKRILQVLTPFLVLLVQVGWDRLWGQGTQRRSFYAIRLREILTDLGPASIKIGQALSTRPDLVSPVFLEELTKLQDKLPPFPNDIAFSLIERELGLPPTEVYQEISQDPVAAASLGQVYKGYLKSGEKVAIKVQRPNLLPRISLDIYIVRLLAQWTKRRFAFIRSDLVGIVDEFASKLYEEMDYVQEGQHAEAFAQLYGHMPIYVPHIHWSYTSRRVLTMEWIDGVKLTHLDQLADAGLDGRDLVEIGVHCSLRQLLEHGFFHADPHPGNLLAMYDGRLAYIDFGMMSQVLPKQRYGLLKAIVHLVNRDFQGLAHDYVELGFLTEDTDLTPIIPALSQVFAEALGASVAELNFKSITDKLSAVMYDYPFRVPAYYALIIRSLVTLEGIAINIDPNFKVLSVAYPYVAGRLLTDPAPELRVSLRDLLFNQGEFRWIRLENLLRNAANSPDFELKDSLEKALDFLFSERGAFLRERLVDVIFNPRSTQSSNGQGTSLDHLQRLWDLLLQNPNFDPVELVPAVLNTLTKPEAQQLGRDLASRWLQREAAHLLRYLFQVEEATSQPRPQLAKAG